VTLEQEAVEAAFGAHVQTLFKTLLSGLATGEDEKACLVRFNAGIALARRAKRLAEQEVQA
jgi:hypothetical protein